MILLKPDIVINGKGRFVYQCIKNYETKDATDSLLDNAQICKLILPSSASTTSTTYDIRIYNDDDSTHTLYLDWYYNLETNWTLTMLDGATTISSGYTTEMQGMTIKTLTATLNLPASPSLGTTGSFILRGNFEDDDKSTDCVAGLTGIYVADYTEVMKLFEALVVDKGLYPSTNTYSSTVGVGEILKIANEMVYNFVGNPWSTKIVNQEIARTYACYLTAKMLLEKTAAYSYHGSGIWVGSIIALDNEIRQLELKLI